MLFYECRTGAMRVQPRPCNLVQHWSDNARMALRAPSLKTCAERTALQPHSRIQSNGARMVLAPHAESPEKVQVV